MKVRIGNDISLNVTLIYNSDNSSVNINSAKAFIINASKEGEFQEYLRNKTRFVSRFPVEPYVDAYSSTAYDIKSCGYPTWNAYPRNYVYGTYSGFGPNPGWEHIYRHMPKHNLTQYQAEVKYTGDRSKIRVLFPAEAQLYTGKYNLVVVAKVYEAGYSVDNLKTITIDYEDVFELVARSQDGIDGAVTINVSSSQHGDHVRAVDIFGTSEIGIGMTGVLASMVTPNTVYDRSVTWSVADRDIQYLTIIDAQSNYCKFIATGLPGDEESQELTISGGQTTINGVQLYAGGFTAITVPANCGITVTPVNEELQDTQIYILNYTVTSILKSGTGSIYYVNDSDQSTTVYLGCAVDHATLQYTISTASYEATIYATSNESWNVRGEYTITIKRDYSGDNSDVYVNSGQYNGDPSNGGNVALTLTNGQQVNVDLSKATGWYEGD